MRRRGRAVPVAAIAIAASTGGRGEGGVAAPLAVRRRVVVLQGKEEKPLSMGWTFRGDENLS